VKNFMLGATKTRRIGCRAPLAGETAAQRAYWPPVTVTFAATCLVLLGPAAPVRDAIGVLATTDVSGPADLLGAVQEPPSQAPLALGTAVRRSGLLAVGDGGLTNRAWVEQAELSPPATWVTAGQLGFAVSVSGTTAVIGCPNLGE
jgi:hypothetical protein